MFQALRQSLRELFPVLGEVQVTHTWGGPLGVPRDWCASAGLDRATGLGWAGGYVGDGVATTNLAGRTLADLVLGHRTEITRLPWVGSPVAALGDRAAALARRERRAARDGLGRPAGGAVRAAVPAGPGRGPLPRRLITAGDRPGAPGNDSGAAGLGGRRPRKGRAYLVLV